jgi:hypothetical protein
MISRRGRSLSQKLLTLFIELSMFLVLLALVAPQYFSNVFRFFSGIFRFLP